MSRSLLILSIILVLTSCQDIFAFQAVDDGKSPTLKRVSEDISSSNTDLLKTHPWLTFQGIKTHERITNVPVPQKYLNKTMYGSVEEDYDAENTSSGSYASLELGYPIGNWLDSERAVNHFYSSPKNDGSDTNGGLCTASGEIKGLPAWKWALTDAANDGRRDDANALRFADVNTSIEEKFKALGHVLHLLEDMGVPAHVRNDPHPWLEPYENFLGKKNYSEYPGFAGFANAEQLIDAAVNRSLPDNYSYNDLRDYFNELSEFTQYNYFSSDTVSDEPETNKSCGIVVKNPVIEVHTETVSKVDTMGEVVETYVNYYINKNTKMRVAAPSAYSVIYQKYYSTQAPLLRYSIIDENCAKDAWQSSAPLIIRNVAGVIGNFYVNFLTPVSVSINPNQTSMTLDWKMPHPSKDGKFRIIRKSDGKTDFIDSASYLDNGLSPSTEYCYEIAYIDSEGNAFGSTEMCGMTLSLPSPPLNVSVKTITSNTVTVNWSVLGDSTLIASFLLYKNGRYLRTVSGNTFNDTDVSANQGYCYSVTTVYMSGEVSGRSCEVCITVPNLVPESTGWEKWFGNGDPSTTLTWRTVQETADQGFILRADKYYGAFYGFGPYYVKLDSSGQFQTEFSSGGRSTTMESTDDGGSLLLGYYGNYGISYGTPYVSRLDQNGNTLWYNLYDYYRRSLYGYFTSAKKTSDGGYMLAGKVNNKGALLLKINEDGSAEWEKIYSDYQGKQLSSFKMLKKVTDVNIIAIGSNSNSDSHSILLLDSNGNILKSLAQVDSTIYPNNNNSIIITNNINNVKITPDGGFVITGNLYDNENYTAELLMSKYDSNGAKQWGKQFPEGGYISSIDVTNDGGFIYVIETSELPSKIVRADSNGNVLWSITRNEVHLSSAHQNSDGSYIFLGNTGQNLALLLKLDKFGNIGTSDANYYCTTSVGDGSTDGPPASM